MRKFFCMLIVGVVMLAANGVFAAKPNVLAEIDAYNFYQNMGYEVDCSHFERVDGKIVFRTILPESPLSLSKDLPNVLVYVETRNNYVVEVDLYLDAGADKNSQVAFVAKVIEALDADVFQKNQAAIEKNIAQVMNAPDNQEMLVPISTDRRYKICTDSEQNVLAVYIEAAS